MSVRKDIFSWALIILVLALVGAAAFLLLEPRLRPHVTIHMGDGVFASQVLKTDKERNKGLSGRPSLGADETVLFVFDTDAKWSMWMKEMKFPIDIVWLDKTKKVVHIVKNVQPESYPQQTFTPTEDARYVIELVGGTVDKKSIKIGNEAMFDENNIEGLKL